MKKVIFLVILSVLFFSLSSIMYASDAPLSTQEDSKFDEHLLDDTLASRASTAHSITVRNYIDKGFRVRFSDAATKVYGYQTSVKNYYEALFDLTMNGYVVSCTSLADDCKTLTYGDVEYSDLNSLCSHTSAHLVRNSIKNDFLSRNGAATNTTSKVLWTGHFPSDKQRSATWPTQNVILITPYATTDSTTNANYSDIKVSQESVYTLFHELAHTLGVYDHYCDLDNKESSCDNLGCFRHVLNIPAPPQCVMSDRENLSTLNLNQFFCSACMADINAHLDEHH